jgi:hypothetical protein
MKPYLPIVGYGDTTRITLGLVFHPFFKKTTAKTGGKKAEFEHDGSNILTLLHKRGLYFSK